MWLSVYFLIISVTSFSAKEVDTAVFACGHGSGNAEEFKCHNGTGCIRVENICNGVPDCPDGSDEIICPFHLEESNLLAFNRSKRQLTCGSDQWQCNDGYCITKDNVCNGVSDCYDDSDEAVQMCNKSQAENSRTCVLPPYPDHGIYKVRNLPNAQPGQEHTSFSLMVICQLGHGVGEPFSGRTAQVYCINGEWSHKLPKCVRYCKLDPDPSIRYLCLSRTGVELCNKYLSPGILIQPVCNSPLYYSTEIFAKMRCNSGYWNYVAVCKAECGRITPSGKQLVIGGTLAKRGELPWHAGIYLKTTTPYTQICGGSLVSNNVVISAAHCFWRDLRKKLPASEFAVAIGKIHRSWDNDEDAGAQKSDVKEIKIPILFQGEAANYQEDIAVLVLSTPVNYTTYIRPVCLNFNHQFDRLQLQHGKLGKVAGWGLTSANGQASPVLKVADVPFINVETCITTIPISFIEYITGDKFCAGYTNGTAALCQGDSGGGLAFSDKELGVDRYYLRGVVSAAPNADDKLCNDNTYITFTKITKHQEFIQEALAASARKICPLYSFQCSDGSCVDSGSECNGVALAVVADTSSQPVTTGKSERLDCADGTDESDEYCQVDRMRISFQQSLQRPIFENPVTRESEPQTPYPVQQLNSPPTEIPLAPRPLSLEGGDQSSSEFNAECGIISGGNENELSFYSGRPYKKGDLPWMVAIFRVTKSSLRFISAGTLITNRHVITGAHIVYLSKKIASIKSFIVKLGVTNVNDWSDDTSITRSLISASVIDAFNTTTLANDISILTLKNRVEFNMFIRPACLWDGDPELSKVVGTVGVFGGWGGVKIEDLGTPHILTLPIVSTESCRASNPAFQFLTSDMTLCAGYRNGSNPCVGDSGAGLFLLHGGKYKFRGVLSLALKPTDERCSLYDYVVFTDVAKYLPWLKRVISETHYD